MRLLYDNKYHFDDSNTMPCDRCGKPRINSEFERFIEDTGRRMEKIMFCRECATERTGTDAITVLIVKARLGAN